jgi:16S rRNA processing protein RimM
MERAPFIALGRVVKAHGMKGEVSVAPFTGPPFFLPQGLRVWLVPPPSIVRQTEIVSVRPGPKGPLVKLLGVDTSEAAKSLAGVEILAAEADIPEDAFVDEPDAVGAMVRDEEHGDLGSITDTLVTGANDVWIVHGVYGEILIPVIDDVVLAYDEDTDTFEVRLLPGLMPEK